MESHRCVLLLVVVVVAVHAVTADHVECQGNWEKRLFKDLFETRHYDKNIRPVKHLHDTTFVTFAITLLRFRFLPEDSALESLIWLKLGWNDEFLSWDPDHFGGVKNVRVDSSMVWLPDIAIYNSDGDDVLLPTSTMVVLDSSGSIIYVPPTKIRSTCNLNKTDDQQTCRIKFGSWTRDGFQIDYNVTSEVDISNLLSIVSDGWKLEKATVERHEKYYDCCKEPYMDATAELVLSETDGEGDSLEELAEQKLKLQQDEELEQDLNELHTAGVKG